MGAEAFAVEGAGPGPAMRRRLAGFIAALRGAGFVVGQAEAQDAARLIAGPLADRPESLRAGLRALFASRRSDLARFDALFDAFWRAPRRSPPARRGASSMGPARTIRGRSRPASAAPAGLRTPPRRAAGGRAARPRMRR